MRLFLRRFPARQLLGGMLLFALLCAAAIAGPKYLRGNVATLIVTTTADSGPGSLRAAIAAASDGDTIQFDPTLNGQGILLTGTRLTISKDVTISGPGPNLLTVQRYAAFTAVFDISSGHTVTIEGITISGGSQGLVNSGTLTIRNCVISNNNSDGGFGGGISTVGGSLTLIDSVVRNNSAISRCCFPEGYGGGISGGPLTIIRSRITGNTAMLLGGGISGNGPLIIDSTIDGNRAGTTNANAAGGGIYGTFDRIINTTISGNIANNGIDSGYGGGIATESNGPRMTIINSCISGNSARDAGGGIGNGSPLTILHSTISGNSASLGGGISTFGNTAIVELNNTIIARGAFGASIVGGTVTSLGYNLSDDNGGGFLTGPGDQINIDPMLGPLQDNGGPTFTRALLPGSHAIDAADPNFNPPPFTDQRGYSRIYDGSVDIGSFELQPVPAPTPTPTPSPCGQVVWSENFDQLPAGTPGSCWSISNTNPDTSPNDAFIADPAGSSDCSYYFTNIHIPTATCVLRFRNNFDTEFGNGVYWDGGVLEISAPDISNGDFLDITDPRIRGIFVTGAYTGLLATTAPHPLAGRFAWSDYSGGYIDTVINLGPNLAGQAITLRFRFGSDHTVSPPKPGWRIDTLLITDEVCPTPTPLPTATATATSTPVNGSPTPTPTPTPAQVLNISTRLRVQTGNNVLIGGFIVTGTTAPKTVAVRGIGPSLSAFGIPDPLADPTLELRASNGTLIMQNDNWQDDPTQAAQLTLLGFALQDTRESGLVTTLAPNASYTAILAGKNGGTGVGLVEIYDTNQAASSQLANISTRGFVLTDNNVMIGGFILGGGSNNAGIAVRGIGPTLTQFGLSPVLADPTLELHDSNGMLLVANDNWQDDPVSAAQLTAHGLAPQDPLESGIFTTLPPGAFTAILAGKDGGTGIGLVEIYNLN